MIIICNIWTTLDSNRYCIWTSFLKRDWQHDILNSSILELMMTKANMMIQHPFISLSMMRIEIVIIGNQQFNQLPAFCVQVYLAMNQRNTSSSISWLFRRYFILFVHAIHIICCSRWTWFTRFTCTRLVIFGFMMFILILSTNCTMINGQTCKGVVYR